jgi:hypothetical protein
MPLPNYLAQALHASPSKATMAPVPGTVSDAEIVTLQRLETRWSGATPESFTLVPNKPALNFGGAPTWAEFIVLRLLERAGWQGVWVKNWGGRAFWTDIGLAAELPSAAVAKFKEIESGTNSKGGCWDVFAWRGDEFLFIESKQRRRDRLRPSQLAWLGSALRTGMPLSSFAIVEWST